LTSCRDGKSFSGFHPVSTGDAFGTVNLAEVTERAREYVYIDSNDLAEHFGDPKGYFDE
jgi:hypothetical protein